MNEIEQKVAELKEALATIADLKAQSIEMKAQVKTLSEKGESEKVGELQTKLEAAELELKKSNDNIDALDKSIKELSKKMEKRDEPQDYNQEVAKVLSSDEFKSALGKIVSGERTSAKFEVKTDPVVVVTGGATNPVSRTMGGDIYSAGYIANKVLAACNIKTVPQDKNRAMWFDGAFYSNVGYVEELTAVTTGDGAALVEKYRELAKIGSKMPFSRETTTDMSYFINWAQNEGKKAILSKIDALLLSGAGADGGDKTKEIYGITAKGATAFNATTAGVAISIEAANIGDLVSACVAQIKIQGNEMYVPNLVLANPSDVVKLRATKDKNENYIGFLPNGSLTLYGLPVAETARVAAGSLYVLDTTTLSLYQKSGIELEIERVAGTDSYVMYLRWRGQLVVPTDAIKGNVYVASIATAIAAIDSATTTTTTEATTTTTTT